MLDRITSGLRRIPFLLTQSNKGLGFPPNSSHVTSWLFNSRDGIDSDEKTVKDYYGNYDGTILQSFCAQGNGTSAYITSEKKLLAGANSFDISCYVKTGADITTTQVVLGENYSFTNGIKIAGSKLVISFRINGTSYTYQPAITINTTYKIRCIYTGSAVEYFVDDVSGYTNTPNGAVSDSDANFATHGYDRNSVPGIGQYLSGCVWNLSVNINGSQVLHWPLQGSAYDVSGNANHGTPTDIAYSTQDNYNYNIINGFDKYLDDATSLIYVYVPYVAGSPVVASIVGYTKQSEHPAGYWCNNAESFIEMTDPIFDKSDANIWKASIRASVYYDSLNPFRWHCSELETSIIMGEIEDAYAHRVFIADNITSFVKSGSNYVVDGDGRFVFAQAGALTRSQDLVVYDAVQTLPTLKFIIDWLVLRF